MPLAGCGVIVGASLLCYSGRAKQESIAAMALMQSKLYEALQGSRRAG
jgi:hypothetical protein